METYTVEEIKEGIELFIRNLNQGNYTEVKPDYLLACIRCTRIPVRLVLLNNHGTFRRVEVEYSGI